jgi:hypothetical protein
MTCLHSLMLAAALLAHSMFPAVAPEPIPLEVFRPAHVHKVKSR